MPSASWSQIEKLSLTYLRKSGPAQAGSLDRCLKRSGVFAEKVSRFFVQSVPGLEEAQVVFCMSEDGAYPEWACSYDEENHVFRVNSVGVMAFMQSCEKAPELLQTREGRGNGDFSVFRLNAYKAELRKLPSRMMMFLLLFQEMARVLNVAVVEHKRSTARRAMEKTDLDYINLLWAFRKVEDIYAQLNGSELRSDVKFTWHEAEWTTGKP